MTTPEPTPDPTSPPHEPPTVVPPSAGPPAPPVLPAPAEFSVGAAQVPATPPFSAPDPAYGAPGYAGGYPVAPAPSSGYGGYGGYGAQPGYYPVYAPTTKTNGLAIASMVVSIVGAVMLCAYGTGGIVGAVGAILGHVSRRQIRDRQESGDGMALAGIITGWIAAGLGLIIIAFIVIAIALAINTAPYDPTIDSGFENSLI